VIEYTIFLHGWLSNGGHNRNEIWRKGSLGDKDDARALNTCIAQRKCAIAHSMIKNMTCVIEPVDVQ